MAAVKRKGYGVPSTDPPAKKIKTKAEKSAVSIPEQKPTSSNKRGTIPPSEPTDTTQHKQQKPQQNKFTAGKTKSNTKETKLSTKSKVKKEENTTNEEVEGGAESSNEGENENGTTGGNEVPTTKKEKKPRFTFKERKAYHDLKKKQKNKLIKSNQELEKICKKKGTKAAQDYFAKLERGPLILDAYAYTHMINLGGRVGNMDFARIYYNKMKENHVKPSIVTYTAYIRGLVSWGFIEEAVEVLRQIPKVTPPNFRTYNTLLRGLLRTDNPDLAMELFNEAEQIDGATDVHTYVYTTLALCYSLRNKEAREMALKLKEKEVVPGTAKAWISVGISDALSGDLSLAKDAVREGEAALLALAKNAEEGKAPSSDDTLVDTESDPKKKKQEYWHKGQRKDFRNEWSYQKENPKDKASYELFSHAQKEEINTLRNLLKEFLQKGKPLPNKIPNILTPPFPTMMILPPKDEVVPTRLHSSQMFEVPVNPTTKIARDVVLEIGSGLGDWILYRAKANPNINYIAAELRHERAFQIWAKATLLQLKNVFVLEVDARLLVERYLAPESLKEVYINFPEPAVREQQHLITTQLLESIHVLLRREGKLIVATDEFHTAKNLAELLIELGPSYQAVHDGKPYLNKLPNDYGASYFDAFWTQGDHHMRFYFEYRKALGMGKI